MLCVGDGRRGRGGGGGCVAAGSGTTPEPRRATPLDTPFNGLCSTLFESVMHCFLGVRTCTTSTRNARVITYYSYETATLYIMYRSGLHTRTRSTSSNTVIGFESTDSFNLCI